MFWSLGEGGKLLHQKMVLKKVVTRRLHCTPPCLQKRLPPAAPSGLKGLLPPQSVVMAKISAVCLLTVLAVAMAAGANAQDYTCTTSDDSPPADVIFHATHNIALESRWCVGADYCTELYKSNAGWVLMYGQPGRCLASYDINLSLRDLLFLCLSDSSGTARASGSYEITSEGVTFVVESPPWKQPTALEILSTGRI